MLSVVKLPVRISDTVCSSLEKIGDSVRDTPEYIFASPKIEKKKRYVPKNVATGLVAGTNSMLKGFANGISGVVMEPYRVRSKGFGAITAGVGKGLLGLVCKPVAGTLEFVAMVVRGVNNTPKSVYRSIKQYSRKRKAKKAEREMSEKRRSEIKEVVVTDNGAEPVWIEEGLEEIVEEHSQSVESEENSALETHSPFVDETPRRMSQREFEEALNEESLMIIPFDVIRLQKSPILEKKVLDDDSVSEKSSKSKVTVPTPTPPPQPPNKYLIAARNWKIFEERDAYRTPEADKKGGLPLTDKTVIKLLRDAGKEILKSLGRKILKGDFNLTTVSFPIKCMQPRTILHNTVLSTQLDALYLNRASQLKDPVERLKLVITARLACSIYTSTFLKPLNPMLGETLHAKCEDGAECFVEQTSHHPPVSHFLIYGPKENYTYSGYYVFAAKAGLNSLNVHNTGKRMIKFKDGQLITMNCCDERYSNTFIGTMRHESCGVLSFRDAANRLECDVRIGEVSGKPTDYLEGFIMQDGKVISHLTGTYLGYLEFDSRRYWDLRHSSTYKIEFDANLPSDSELRPDLVSLREGRVDEAQVHKEALEEMQRQDRKLRSNLA
mmetsp:Transcript_26456/g.47471  ORF Transcript_26456/g.47471 Transcript_26456/m.47471 type:complete len:609 (-) Transcript_26456:1698-3524(-)